MLGALSASSVTSEEAPMVDEDRRSLKRNISLRAETNKDSDVQNESVDKDADPSCAEEGSASESSKRMRSASPASSSSASGQPVCKYGKECYRKNSQHFQEFSHPDKRNVSGRVESVHDLFLTSVHGLTDNKVASLDIRELLSSGTLKSSVQFNYLIDLSWLIAQYPAKFREKPILVVHGSHGATSLRSDRSRFSQVSLCEARLDIPFGVHHTKMMLLEFEEGLRVVVHTANLIKEDWALKTQGVWMSPLLLPGKADSATRFSADLAAYLRAYKVPALSKCADKLSEYDFSPVRVHFVASVPGYWTDSQWGHLKMRAILPRITEGPLVAQCSSLGSLTIKWLDEELSRSLGASPKLIWPSVDDVRESLEGYPAGGSLPYSHRVASKQPWLQQRMHRWRCDRFLRTRACPHIKTYARFSKDWSRCHWLLLTSANLSKAAWGATAGQRFLIRSYEAGVLFLASQWDTDMFVTEEFVVPFDVPPQPYHKEDRPWVYDLPYTDKPDTHGMSWQPS